MGVRWTPRAANDRAAQSRREVESHLQLQKKPASFLPAFIFAIYRLHPSSFLISFLKSKTYLSRML